MNYIPKFESTITGMICILGSIVCIIPIFLVRDPGNENFRIYNSISSTEFQWSLIFSVASLYCLFINYALDIFSQSRILKYNSRQINLMLRGFHILILFLPDIVIAPGLNITSTAMFCIIQARYILLLQFINIRLINTEFTAYRSYFFQITSFYNISICFYTWAMIYNSYELIFFLCSIITFLIGYFLTILCSYRFIIQLLILKNNTNNELSIKQIINLKLLIFLIIFFTCQIIIMIGYYFQSFYIITSYIPITLYIKNILGIILFLCDSRINLMKSNKVENTNEKVSFHIYRINIIYIYIILHYSILL
jgi:hypothetical protein